MKIDETVSTFEDGRERIDWLDSQGDVHSVWIDEDIKLNRKRAVQALRTADESLRCSGEVFEESYDYDDDQAVRSGRMCAIGVMFRELGIDKEDMGQTYTLFGVNPGVIYGPNDYNLGTDSEPRYRYSWSDIADTLASKWGID